MAGVKIIHMSNAPTHNEASDSLVEFFGEPISVYTDAQGLEDGFLVAVPGPSGVNRVTRAVFDHFVEPMGTSPITGPVTDITPLMDAIRAMLQVPPDDGWRAGEYRGKRLWLIPNEVRGLTLMFPEDY